MINTVTTGKVMSLEELSEVKGRAWDDVDVSSTFLELLLFFPLFHIFLLIVHITYPPSTVRVRKNATQRTRRWKAKMLTQSVHSIE